MCACACACACACTCVCAFLCLSPLDQAKHKLGQQHRRKVLPKLDSNSMLVRHTNDVLLGVETEGNLVPFPGSSSPLPLAAPTALAHIGHHQALQEHSKRPKMSF